MPGTVELADTLGGGFSGTPFLSAATLMAIGVAPGNFGLRDSGVGAGGLLSRSEAHYPPGCHRSPKTEELELIP